MLGLIAGLAAAPVVQAAEQPLIMGIFPRHKAADTTTMYTPLAEHLSERLGRKVVLVTSKDFDAFWKAQKDRLAAVPVKATLTEVPSEKPGFLNRRPKPNDRIAANFRLIAWFATRF